MKLNEVVKFGKINNNYIDTTHNKYNLNRFTNPLTGIEVEVESVNIDHATRNLNGAWSATSDGSLRNGGVEFVTVPLKPENVESALHHLYANCLNSACHFSPRTSIHVHLDCRNLTLDQIYNIIILYQCFESLLYGFAGNERKKSIFCVPLANTSNYLNTKNHLVVESVLPNWNKYTGINLSRINEIGTIEFRHLRGTKDYTIICMWLEILYELYNYAISRGTTELESNIIAVRKDRTYSNFINDVFKNTSNLLIKDDSWAKDMEQDVSMSKLYMGKIKLERAA